MAAINFNDYGDRPDGGSFAAALNWAGALLSVLLIVGLATWGWKLWVRDVTGVPVVRALEGPMRIAPEEPGGLATEYQGLAVNRIAEERGETSMADRVVLAPEPTVLNEAEDLTMAELAPAPLIEPEPETLPSIDTGMVGDEGEIVEVAPAPEFGEDGETGLAAVPEIPVEPRSATDLAVAAALGIVFDDPAPEAAVMIVDAGPGVPAATPRPVGRPENLQSVSFSPAADGVTGEIDPSTIPVGTRLVQLGAYGSAEVARTEWANAIAKFGDYMVGKDRVVQEAQTGGRTFWRLRAMGFADLADARRFCSVLVADGANCIPVVQE
jgi:SPOR domain